MLRAAAKKRSQRVVVMQEYCTGNLYLEAGINGRYVALTKSVVIYSCVSLYDVKAI